MILSFCPISRPPNLPSMQTGGTGLRLSFPISAPHLSTTNYWKPFRVDCRERQRTESPKVRNRRLRQKFNGTARRPRLSVFCSEKQLYAMLVDDRNKKCLFYGSTLQKSICESGENPSYDKMVAAERIGEELIKACMEQKINEISSYDQNGFARGERMAAFETSLINHGFLPPWRSDKYKELTESSD